MHFKKNPKILVVEDNPINMELVFEILKSKNINVECAWNGKEAIEKAAKEVFDLIIMDIKLPKMNGIEVKNNIKKMMRYRNVPVIALTAFSMIGDRERFLDEGFDEYISKPFNISELTIALEKLLNQSI